MYIHTSDYTEPLLAFEEEDGFKLKELCLQAYAELPYNETHKFVQAILQKLKELGWGE